MKHNEKNEIKEEICKLYGIDEEEYEDFIIEAIEFLMRHPVAGAVVCSTLKKRNIDIL